MSNFGYTLISEGFKPEKDFTTIAHEASWHWLTGDQLLAKFQGKNLSNVGDLSAQDWQESAFEIKDKKLYQQGNSSFFTTDMHRAYNCPDTLSNEQEQDSQAHFRQRLEAQGFSADDISCVIAAFNNRLNQDFCMPVAVQLVENQENPNLNGLCKIQTENRYLDVKKINGELRIIFYGEVCASQVRVSTPRTPSVPICYGRSEYGIEGNRLYLIREGVRALGHKATLEDSKKFECVLTGQYPKSSGALVEEAIQADEEKRPIKDQFLFKESIFNKAWNAVKKWPWKKIGIGVAIAAVTGFLASPPGWGVALALGTAFAAVAVLKGIMIAAGVVSALVTGHEAAKVIAPKMVNNMHLKISKLRHGSEQICDNNDQVREVPKGAHLKFDLNLDAAEEMARRDLGSTATSFWGHVIAFFGPTSTTSVGSGHRKSEGPGDTGYNGL